MSQTYSSKADFLNIYIREAHPVSGWHMENIVDYKEPTTIDERKAALQKIFDLYELKMTFVMDEMSDKLENQYQAWPERLYVVKNGMIVFKGGVGPFDYNPEELKQWLDKN